MSTKSIRKTGKKSKRQGGKNEDWSLSENYLEKARTANGTSSRQEEYLLWKQAYEHALKSSNNEVIFQAGHSLGFDFFEFTKSLKEILEIQMNCVKAACAKETANTTKLRIIGMNLFEFWRQIEFRRLSEHEIQAKQLVIDGAKNLEKADFDQESAAPIMVMLISKVFEFDGPCIEWAQHETAILDIPIPESIQRKIGSFLPQKGL